MEKPIRAMNFFQRANLTAAFFSLTFLVTGIALNSSETISINDYVSLHSDSVLLAIFIINFRLKVLLDDHKYFSNPMQDKRVTRLFGFIVGVYSWTFWGLASLSINNPGRSCYLLICAITFSTLWLIIDTFELSGIGGEEAAKDRRLNIIWGILNVLYITILFLYAEGDMEPHFNRWILLVPNLALCYDYFESKSYADII